MSEETKTEVKPKGPGKKLFQKGNPGGPGYPKGMPNYKVRFAAALEEFSRCDAPEQVVAALAKAFPSMKRKFTITEAESLRVHLAALQGEAWAYDRLHGKAVQAVDHTTNGKDMLPAPPTTMTVRIAKD
jgi:hypothetical protein